MNAEIKLRKAENGYYIATDGQGREYVIPADLERLFHWVLWELERRGPGQAGDGYGRVVVVTKRKEGG